MEQPAVPLAGPRLKPHRCTDPICFLIYGLVCIGLLFCGGYGATQGNPKVLEKFIYGTNNQGLTCGVDSEVRDFPLTFYALPLNGVVSDWNAWTEDDRAQLKAVCTNACPQPAKVGAPHPATARSADLCTASATAAGMCTWYGGATHRVANYCLDANVFLSDPTFGGFIADISSAKWVVMFVPLISVMLAAGFLFLLYKCGIIVVWIGVLLAISAPVLLGVFFFIHAQNGDPDDQLSSVIPLNAQRTTAYVLWGAGGFMALFSLCLCRSINSAGKILSFTSDFIRDVPSQMLQPIAFGISQLVIILVGISILVVMATVGAETPTDQADLQKCITNGDFMCVSHMGHKGWLEVYVIAVTVWIMMFCSALSHYATAWSFSHWYFASTDPNEARMPLGSALGCCDFMITIKGICSGLGNHTGSLAIGSLAVTIVKLLRMCLFWVSRSDQAGGNVVTHCIACICNCLASCLDKCVQFVTEHTYVEIALTGRGFCSSMRRAMSLAASRADLFAIVANVAFALELAGPLIVAFGTSSIVFLVLLWIPPKGLTGPSAPVVVAFLVGLFIGEVMVHPVATACRAAVHCFALDEEQTEEQTGTKCTRYAPAKLHGFVVVVQPDTAPQYAAPLVAAPAGAVTLS